MNADKQSLLNSISVLEQQRNLLGDEAVNAALRALKQQLKDIESKENSKVNIEGERKLITIVFADLSGFTAMSEKLDPEVLRQLINKIFKNLVTVIQQYGGYIEKYIGDAVLALFGAPISYEDHASRAMKASLAMMRAMEEFNSSEGLDLGLHIGVNSGEVVTGMIGSGTEKQYGVIGKSVNLAARLEQISERGQILVGEESFKMTNHLFHFKSISVPTLKGISQTGSVYQLLSNKEGKESKWMKSTDVPMIGREKEKELLVEALQKLDRKQGGCVAIIGPAGIGKSRLLAELEKQGKSKFSWTEGRALSYHQDTGYLAIGQALSKLLQLTTLKKTQEIKKQLIAETKELFPNSYQDITPFLSLILRLSLDENEAEHTKYLSSTVLLDRLKIALTSYLIDKSIQKPLVLVWEDLHWADEASLDIIRHLIENLVGHSILQVLVFRPEKTRRIWQIHQSMLQKERSDYCPILLDPLSKTKSNELVHYLMKETKINESVIEEVFNRSEGNPLFIEELIRALETRLKHDSKTQLNAGFDKRLPSSLRGVISSRIDGLDTESKSTLQAFAVLGRIFSDDIARNFIACLGYNYDLTSIINKLTHTEFIRKRNWSDDVAQTEYIFNHVLLYDVAYDMLLKSRRNTMHHTAARMFEAIAEKTTFDNQLSNIAYHYERTDLWIKAAEYLEKAGDQARSQHINKEAIQFYKKALEKLNHEEGEKQDEINLFRLTEKLAKTQEMDGSPVDAIESYELALQYLKSEDTLNRARILRLKGVSQQAAHQFDLAFQSYSDAKDLLESHREPDNQSWWYESIELKLDLLFLLYWKNDTVGMADLLEKSNREIQLYGTKGQITRLYQEYVMYYLRVENYTLSDEAMQYAVAMKDSCKEVTDVRIVSLTKFLWAFALLWHNDSEQSIAAFEDAAKTSEKFGDMLNMMRSINYLSLACRRTDRLAPTIMYTEKNFKMAEALNLPEYMGIAEANRVWINWKKNEFQQALVHSEMAEKYIMKFTKETGWPFYPFWWVLDWPHIAVHFSLLNFAECCKSMKRLLGEGQKPLEQDLVNHMDQSIKIPPSDHDMLRKQIGETIELAKKYQYI